MDLLLQKFAKDLGNWLKLKPFEDITNDTYYQTFKTTFSTFDHCFSFTVMDEQDCQSVK
jgi:hypothetical protein